MGNLKPYAILLKAVKIGEKNLGELLVIRQICQIFYCQCFYHTVASKASLEFLIESVKS